MTPTLGPPVLSSYTRHLAQDPAHSRYLINTLSQGQWGSKGRSPGWEDAAVLGHYVTLTAAAFRILIKHHYDTRAWAACFCAVEDVPLEDAVSWPVASSEAPGDTWYHCLAHLTFIRSLVRSTGGLLQGGTTWSLSLNEIPTGSGTPSTASSPRACPIGWPVVTAGWLPPQAGWFAWLSKGWSLYWVAICLPVKISLFPYPSKMGYLSLIVCCGHTRYFQN